MFDYGLACLLWKTIYRIIKLCSFPVVQSRNKSAPRSENCPVKLTLVITYERSDKAFFKYISDTYVCLLRINDRYLPMLLLLLLLMLLPR